MASAELADRADTRDTPHLWTQVVGKVRMAHAPVINHWWHVTRHVSARGLTTSTIPYQGGAFEIEFDFVDHQLHIRTSEGERRSVELASKPVAAFYTETTDALDDLGIPTRIHAVPNEVDPAIPFAQDQKHASYDAYAAHPFWRQLLRANQAYTALRSGFVGVSPVHFFWGAMDLACTRFFGRPAPPHPGGGAPNCPD